MPGSRLVGIGRRRERAELTDIGWHAHPPDRIGIIARLSTKMIDIGGRLCDIAVAAVGGGGAVARLGTR
jgi:hypothetical protein